MKSALSKDFLHRLIEAMDSDPYSFAHQFDIPYADVLALWKGTRGQVERVCDSEIFTTMRTHVDDRIGKLMGVREELNRKAAQDDKKRLADRARIANR